MSITKTFERLALISLASLTSFGSNSFGSLPSPSPGHPPVPSSSLTGVQEMPQWRLRPGQTRTLQLETLHRFSVSGSAIRAAPLPDSSGTLLIKATQAGHSEIWIWTQPSNVKHLSILVVSEEDSAEPAAPAPGALQAATETLREAEVFWTGSKAILSGQIRTESELRRIRSLAETHPDLVMDQTELSPELLETGRSRIQGWISSLNPPPQIQVTEHGGQIHVRGSAPQSGIRTSWEQKLKSLFAGVRLEITTLTQPDQTLFFRVALLELKRRAFRSLGVSWPSQITYGLRAQVLPSVDLELQALEQQGAAKVLSKPELVVRVPGEAELFSGGEIPIETRTARGFAQVQWKPYGLSLKLKALELSGDQVRLEISSEVSDIDRANGSPTLPALQSSRLHTQVDAALGASLFLSGLFQSRTASASQGVPFLSRIPLIGRLFGSHDDTEEQSELVAILLPLRSPPPPPQPQLQQGEVAPPPKNSSSPVRDEIRDYLPTGLTRELGAHP